MLWRIVPETRAKVIEAVQNAPEGCFVEFKDGDVRTLAQNATIFMWLTDILTQETTDQFTMPNGKKMTPLALYYRIASKALNPVEWKDKNGEIQQSAPSPSRLSKSEFSVFMEAVQVLASYLNVKLRDPALYGYEG